MGVKWTKEQQSVIDLRNRNILVSAAAGSGKTAVLVERIITRIVKDEINIDELLIVTFTEAAAAEMKERILAAVEKQLKETPQNEHLQRQTALVHNANIMTIHSFCLSVIKTYFYKIDLDPVFRTGDEGELKLIKRELLELLLEEEYEKGEESFLNFVETFAPGKSDVSLMGLILNVFEYSRSTPQPRMWLEQCLEKYNISNSDEFHASDIGKEMDKDISLTLESMLKLICQGISLCETENEMAIYKRFFEADKEALLQIINCEDREQREALIKVHKWGQLRLKKEEKDSLVEEADKRIKDFRDKIKSLLKEKVKDRYYSSPLEEQIKFYKQNTIIIKELVRIVIRFEEMYDQKKRAIHVIDYSDMEQFALKILNDLKDGELIPSYVAKEYQNKFKEIMIDEYQDSNLVQEAILTSVSGVSQGNYNIFMVGDVKQSIYSFRLSRPELFINKYDTYKLEDSLCQRVDLHKNFRSRGEVLSGTNQVFYKIMQSDLGEINYDDKSALYVGADFPDCTGNELELRLIDLEDINDISSDASKQESTEFEKATKIELEARDVALRIKELMQQHQVIDKKTGKYRALKYSDIAILTRSKKKWNDTFSEVLGEEGIPLEVESTAGYFDCWEVSVLLNFLTVIDNPKQDIPLAGVLTSVFGKLTSEELAVLRVKYPKWKFTDSVFNYAEQVEDKEYPELLEKVQKCIKQIERYRDMNTYASTYELLWKIMDETGYRYYISGMSMGEQRVANAELLLQKAMQYQKTSYKGIFNFIRYVDELRKNEVEVGQAPIPNENSDTVKIMTIHKSKGLEFPIVFLVGAGKQFNESDNKETIIIHPTLGLGIDYMDYNSRVKHKTIVKNVIANRKKMDGKGEELRVLYVAMTRAKEKLIITGSVKELEKKLHELNIMTRGIEGALSYYQRSTAITYLEWLLPAMYHHKGFDKIKEDYNIKADRVHIDRKLEIPFLVHKITLDDLVGRKIKQIDICDKSTMDLEADLDMYTNMDSEIQTNVMDRINYVYPYEHESKYKIKVSVTELKKRALQMEEALMKEGTQIIERISQAEPDARKSYTQGEKIIPSFMNSKVEKVNIATERGNAIHRFMEIWDYTLEASKDNVTGFIQEQLESGRLREKEEQYLEIEGILLFLNSPLGLRMSESARINALYKEQPFVMGIPAREIYGHDSEEVIILQGIIDVYLNEEDGITIIDYKTDRVKDIMVLKERYETQLNLYAKAVEQITGKKVKEKIIYSFAKGTSLVL